VGVADIIFGRALKLIGRKDSWVPIGKTSPEIGKTIRPDADVRGVAGVIEILLDAANENDEGCVVDAVAD
jgi:hypothetical protein